MSDRFNIASGELEEVRARCEELGEMMAIALVSPPPNFPAMAEALLGGVHNIVPAVHPPAFTAFTHSLLPGFPHTALKLSWYSTFVLKLMVSNVSPV